MSNTNVNWFEIPVKDLERAVLFYTNVLEAKFMPMETPQGNIQAFLNGENPVGALVTGEYATPSADGAVIYFNCEDIPAALEKVEVGGGTVIVPETPIGPFGFIAQFLDSEGNRVALHKM